MTDNRNGGTSGGVDRAVQALIDASGHQTAAQVQALIDAAGHQTAAQVQALIDAAGHQTAAQVQAAIRTALVGHATTVALTAAVNAIRQLPAGGDDGQILGRAAGAPAWVAPASVLPETLARALDPWPAYPPGGARAGQPYFKGGDDDAGPRGWYEPVGNPVQPLYRFRLTIGNGPLANQHGYVDASAVAALSTSFGAAGDPEAGRNVPALFWRNTTETTELRLSKAWAGTSPANSFTFSFHRADTGALVNSITVSRNAAADDADNWAYRGGGAPDFTSGQVDVTMPTNWRLRHALIWRKTNTPQDLAGLVRSLEALTGAARLDRTALRGPHVVPPVTAAPAVAALRPGELVNVQASAAAAPALKIARAAYDTPVTHRNRVVLTTDGHGNYRRGGETGSASDNYRHFVGLVSWAADDAGTVTLDVGLRLDLLGASPPRSIWVDGVRGRGAARTLFEQYSTGQNRTIDGVVYRRYVSNRFPVAQQAFQGLQTWEFHLSASGAGSPLNVKPATEHTAASLADVVGAAPQLRSWTSNGTVSGPSYCSWLVMVWGAGGGGGAGGKRHNNGASGGETRISGPDLQLLALGGAGGHAPEETDGWNGQHAAGGSAGGSAVGSGGLIVAGGGAGGGQEGGDRVRRGDDLVGQPGRPGGLVIAQVRPTAGAAYRITIGAGGAGGADASGNDSGGNGGAGRVAILEMRMR